MVIVLPIAGKISDEFGRRRVFFYAVILFTVSSLLCGLSTNIYMLVGFRAMQAIGGGALQPSAAGIVAEHFGRDRDRAIGMFGTIASGGQVLGPVIGGVLVGYLSWRWIFFVNVPIGIVLLGALVKFVPESRGARSQDGCPRAGADGAVHPGRELRHHQHRQQTHDGLRPGVPGSRGHRARGALSVRPPYQASS